MKEKTILDAIASKMETWLRKERDAEGWVVIRESDDIVGYFYDSEQFTIGRNVDNEWWLKKANWMSANTVTKLIDIAVETEKKLQKDLDTKVIPIHEFADIMSNDFVIGIVKEYGPVNQSIVLMEELNELLTETVKAMQLEDNKAQLAEEISHCMISFCTYGYAYNLNWDVNISPKVPVFSSTDFILMLADVQKEISKKMRGKNNDDALCEKMGICFGELQKCMSFYDISWDMIREEVLKKVSRYSPKKTSQDLAPSYIGSTLYRIDIDPNVTNHGEYYEIKAFEITSVEKYWDGNLVLKSGDEEVCLLDDVDTKNLFLDYYVTFSSKEQAEEYIEDRQIDKEFA